MTINEAIKHCEEVMMENLEKTKDRNASDPIAINCFECADEHRQLAEWLKDYKRLLEQEPKIGHWIYDDECHEHGHCSKCGAKEDLVDGRIYNYCRVCGTKMESEVSE